MAAGKIISDCPRPRVVHTLPSQEEAPTHLACGGLDGAGSDGVSGGDLTRECCNHDDLFVLAELCLLLAPRLALPPGLVRHAVGSEGRADGRAPAREPGLEDATDDIEHASLDDAAADRL